MSAPFEILKDALNAEYRHMMPQGFSIYRLAEYDPKQHTAPHLHFEKREKPNSRYIAILASDTASASALGETVNDAVKACILKLENDRSQKQ